MRWLVLIIPSAVLVFWLTYQGIHFALHGVGPTRTWTLGERLLTEARILCDYLSLLWLPHPYTAGLFNDAIATSTSLLSPPTTLAAVAFLTALLLAAVVLGQRAPTWSAAILFFFCGHLLESSVIPLELYYEHRNYLPAMLMFWPLAIGLTGTGEAVAMRRVLAVVLPFVLAAMTFMRADLWGNPQQQAFVWAEKNPDSPRAQAYAAAAERARGRPDLAATRTLRAHVMQTEDIQVSLNLVGAQCELGRVDEAALQRAQAALRSSRTAGRLYYGWISEAIERLKRGEACNGLGPTEIEALIGSMEQNPNSARYRGWRQDNLGLRALLAIAQHDPRTALKYLEQSVAASPDGSIALAQAAQLGSAGYPVEGLALLDYYDSLAKPAVSWTWSMASLHAWVLRRQGYEEKEMAHLRGVLEQDVRDGATPSQ
jgi:hypothetical protein